MKFHKGQAGVETVILYGVVILAAVGGIILFSQTGIFNPVATSKNQFAFSQVIPLDWAVYQDNNVIVLRVENGAGYPIEVTHISASVGGIVCEKDVSGVYDTGGKGIYSIECPAGTPLSGRFRVGEGYTADVTFTYKKKDPANPADETVYESKGRVTGPVEAGMAVTTTTTTTTEPGTTAEPPPTTTAVDEPPKVWLQDPPNGAAITIP